LSKFGITAGTDSNGALQFSGATAFTVKDTFGAGATAASALTTATGGTAENTSNNLADPAATYVSPATTAETLQFQTSAGAASVTLAIGTSLASAISDINQQTSSLGVYAVTNAAGTGISLQGANSFSVTDSATATEGVFGAASTGTNNLTATAPAAGDTNNANAAITAINNAISALGLVQGSVGAGENKLSYAINLAQSQISSYSSAESQIRDADVAEQAANLTKAQVLTQTSVAALAQANSEPQAILKLLQ
jgi:flagellin